MGSRLGLDRVDRRALEAADQRAPKAAMGGTSGAASGPFSSRRRMNSQGSRKGEWT